jgi:hypothetical protein
MKVATVSAAGERSVGQIARDGTSVALFDLALSEAQDRVLALIRRNGVMPPTLSPILLRQVTIEAPSPVLRRNILGVGKTYYEHAYELTRNSFDTGATETSAAVGIGSDPPKYRKGGDVVRIEIGIGILESGIVERTT